MLSFRSLRTSTPRISRTFTTTTIVRATDNKMPGSNVPQSDPNKPVLNKEGTIGRQFQPDGAIGGAAQKVGGPFDKDGVIGKNFNADRGDSKIGGTVNETLGKDTKK